VGHFVVESLGRLGNALKIETNRTFKGVNINYLKNDSELYFQVNQLFCSQKAGSMSLHRSDSFLSVSERLFRIHFTSMDGVESQMHDFDSEIAMLIS
jgi:hypothetical protein